MVGLTSLHLILVKLGSLSTSPTSSGTYQIISHLTKLKRTRVLRNFSRFPKVVSISLPLQTKTLLLQPYLFNHLTFLDIAWQIWQALLLLHWAQNDWIHSKQAKSTTIPGFLLTLQEYHDGWKVFLDSFLTGTWCNMNKLNNPNLQIGLICNAAGHLVG